MKNFVLFFGNLIFVIILKFSKFNFLINSFDKLYEKDVSK